MFIIALPALSIRITLAPWSASTMPQKGPGASPAISITLMPFSAMANQGAGV